VIDASLCRQAGRKLLDPMLDVLGQLVAACNRGSAI
jgi:hypothetical protein